MPRRTFLARLLSPEESQEAAVNVPKDWYEPRTLGALGYGGGATDIPFASGLGFVSSPFSSYYERAWGVLPSPDQARFRLIYRTVPAAHTAIDKLVESALAKGFGIEVMNKRNPKAQVIEQTIADFRTAHPELEDEVLKPAGKDLLTHGSCYVEPCYAETAVDVINANDQDAPAKLPDLPEMKANGVFSRFQRFHPAFIGGLTDDAKVPVSLYVNPLIEQQNPDGTVQLYGRGKSKKGKPSQVVWFKPLDFLTMRPRRDAWGNIFGAIQYLVVPPVAFNTDKVIMGKWNGTSTFYESAFGVSLLQSLIRTQEAIWQIENDLLIIGHALAKPPHTFNRGIVDPKTGFVALQAGDAEWASFQSRMAQRQAGSDLFLPPWTQGTPLPSPGTSIAPLIAHLHYHQQQRTIALRVPPQLLGVPEGSTRTTASVNQGDYILTVQTLQVALGRVLEQMFDLVLKPFAEELGDDYEVPRVKWNPIMERDESVELGKVMDAFTKKVITLGEARHLLRERGIFELPDEDSEEGQAAIEELQLAAQPAAGMGAPGGDAPAAAYAQDQTQAAKASRSAPPARKKAREPKRDGPPDGVKLDKHTVEKPNFAQS